MSRGERSDDRLRLIVERIERLLEERRGISDDIRDVYAEAKAVGYDTRTIRALVARRAMPADARAEADALLEVYEAALGGVPIGPATSLHEDGSVNIPDARPDTAALATALLAEELAGMDDPERAALLVEHVTCLLDLRAEIALLRQQEGARKKQAAGEGFDAKQIGVTVRWYEKVAKHGLKVMRAAEETFRLYRGTVDAGGPVAAGRGPVTEDPKLGALFAPEKPRRKSPVARWLTEHEETRRALGDD